MSDPEPPFDPAHLLPAASLNLTRIGADTPCASRFHDALGYDLLAAPALEHLSADDAGTLEAGTRIAALIAALTATDGTDGLGVDPTPWRLAYLRHWHRVEEVWLAGGNAARFGNGAATIASGALAQHGVRVTVRAHPHAAVLPLLGAARTVPARHAGAAVLDFGHSFVKRSTARFDADGSLRALEVHDALQVGGRDSDIAHLVHTAIDGCRGLAPPATVIRAAVAAYVTRRGTIDDARSIYNDAFRPQRRDLTIVHDGTAAALAIDTRATAAVISLGTALGVGLVTDEWRRPLSEHFGVVRSRRETASLWSIRVAPPEVIDRKR